MSQEDDSNAAAAALEANFPDTVKKNKRRKAGSSAAVIPALAEAGGVPAHNTVELLVHVHARTNVGGAETVDCPQASLSVADVWQSSLQTCWCCFEARLSFVYKMLWHLDCYMTCISVC